MHTLRKICLSAAILLSVCSLYAADILPVTIIDGKKYYEYVVPKGETVYAITRHFGITRAEFMENNPSVASGLKAGSIVLIPVESVKEGRAVAQPVIKVTDADYTHLVKKGETLYGISKKYDTTVEKLIALNPWAEKGIKAGQTLRIPINSEAALDDLADAPSLDPFDIEETPTADSILSERPVEETIGAPELPSVPEEVSDPSEESGNTMTEEPEYNIAVLLPFMLNTTDEISAQAQAYTTFFKGMMIAADSLGRKQGANVTISAYDTEGSQTRIAELLDKPEVRDADVIIAPPETAHLTHLADASDSEEFRIFNIFAVQDETFREHPHLMQANIPHSQMYIKAIQAMAEMFPDYTLVTLYSQAGASDKEAFVKEAVRRYRIASMPVEEITYESSLRPEDLNELPAEGKYIFLPYSGSLSEFNRIQGGILGLKQRATDPENVKVFGYPDWLSFRLDRRDRLHEMDATIYSRFADVDNERATAIDAALTRWYGDDIKDTIPRQDLLGFDVAAFLITSLRAGDFPANGEMVYKGVQSSFLFPTPINDSEGTANTALYIISFHPDKTTETLIK